MNIEKASISDLESLPKIGAAKAKKIHELQQHKPITIRMLVEATGLAAEHFRRLIEEKVIAELPLDTTDYQTEPPLTRMERRMMDVMASFTTAITDLTREISQRDRDKGRQQGTPLGHMTDGMNAYMDEAQGTASPSSEENQKNNGPNKTDVSTMEAQKHQEFVSKVMTAIPEDSHYVGSRSRSQEKYSNREGSGRGRDNNSRGGRKGAETDRKPTKTGDKDRTKARETHERIKKENVEENSSTEADHQAVRRASNKTKRRSRTPSTSEDSSTEDSTEESSESGTHSSDEGNDNRGRRQAPHHPKWIHSAEMAPNGNHSYFSLSRPANHAGGLSAPRESG